MEKKHILITYTNTGGGHKVPAEAVAAALEEIYPNQYRITLSDFFADAGETGFNKFICTGWDWLLAHPTINFFNIKLSQILAPITHLFLPILYHRVWKSSMAYLDKIKPDLVFTTHFYCQNIAIDARTRYKLNYPLITLNPDSFETFALWDHRGDVMLVHSEMAYKNALRWRHKPEHLMIVPQALRKSFDTPKGFDKKAIRRALGLDEGRFTLFFSDGGQGIGAMEEFLQSVIDSRMRLNVICICARNEALLQRLNALGTNPGNICLKAFGFTNNMAELLAAADLFIGKAGPASVIEALKMKLPAIITYAVNTAETNTRSFFTQQKMAWSCSKASLLPDMIKNLIDRPQEYQEAVRAIEASHFFDNGSPIIARIISEAAENPSSLPDIVRQGLK